VATEKVFVVLKGPRTVSPLSAHGLDEIVRGARGRAGLGMRRVALQRTETKSESTVDDHPCPH
jgi:hypothetical protein